MPSTDQEPPLRRCPRRHPKYRAENQTWNSWDLNGIPKIEHEAKQKGSAIWGQVGWRCWFIAGEHAHYFWGTSHRKGVPFVTFSKCCVCLFEYIRVDFPMKNSDFSIAMLNYQRLIVMYWEDTGWIPPATFSPSRVEVTQLPSGNLT